MKRIHYNKVSSYFLRHKFLVFLICLTGLLFDGLMVVIPLWQGKLLLEVSNQIPFKNIISSCLLFFLFIIFVQINRFLKRYFVRLFANKITVEMREKAFKNIMNEDELALFKMTKGDILNRLFNDINDACEGIRKVTTEVFDTLVLLVAYFVSLFILDYKLSFIVLTFVIVAMLVSYLFKAVVYKYTKKQKKVFGNLKDETLNMIENEYEYRSLGISQPLDREYEKTLEKNYKLAIRSNVLQGSMTPLYHATALLGVIFIIYFGGLNYQIGAWEIDAFSAYLTTYALIATKASKVGKMVNAAQKGKIAWGRFKYLLRDYSPKIKKEISFPIKLELQNVSFGFDQHCRFQNLNYSFKSGEVIGISGPVYSGKSTFASLLSGLYKYDGTIKVNGEELEKMQKEYETNLLGVMSFNNDIFSMTVKENIELGRKGEFDKVFSIVGLDKEIDESTNPFSLSGGQKRRLLIARAIFLKNPIIVLDDPFNSLDIDMAKEILLKIKAYCHDSIIFVVSNEISILKQCDKILQLSENQKGRNIKTELKDVMSV